MSEGKTRKVVGILESFSTRTKGIKLKEMDKWIQLDDNAAKYLEKMQRGRETTVSIGEDNVGHFISQTSGSANEVAHEAFPEKRPANLDELIKTNAELLGKCMEKVVEIYDKNGIPKDARAVQSGTNQLILLVHNSPRWRRS